MAGPAPTGTVNFWSPQAVLAPDLAVQQQQIDRQRALAMALQQQALEPIDAGRGQVSWTQGVAKLVQALSAGLMNRKQDKAQTALNQAYSDRMFGRTPQTPVPDTSNILTMGDNGSTVQAVPNPQPAPQLAPQSAPQQPQGGMGDMIGNVPGLSPLANYSDWAADPSAHYGRVAAANAPTDFTKLLTQSGIDPASPLGQQLMQSQIAKQNNVPPVQIRQGGIAIDPITHQPIFYNPQVPEGAAPSWNANGQPTGVSMLDGASAAIGAAAGAKAGGTAAGQAPYDLVEVTDAQGNKYQIPKSAIPGIGGGAGAPAGRGAPSAGAPGVQAGPGGVGVMSGRGPGQQAADTEAGKRSASAFQAAVDSGNGTRDAMRQIDNIMGAAKGLQTGPGSEIVSEAKSAWNAVVPDSMKFDTNNIAKFDEMRKNAAALGLSLSNAAGQGSTDARLKTALDALPNAKYSPAAIQEVGYNLKGLQAGALGRAQAAAQWQMQHGSDSYPAFQQAWQQAYNPDIFYYMQKGTGAYQQWFKGMSAPQQARVMNQYRQMKAMGGL